MGKRKKRKNSEEKNPNNLAELKGFGLLLIAIIGCCPFGPVADVIKGFSAFLVGTWWAVLLVFIGICGIYMIIKREKPNFLDAKFFGLYIILLAILILSHTSYLKVLEDIDVNKFDIVDDTWLVVERTVENVMSFVNSNNGALLPAMKNLGGGIVGAIFSGIFVALLTLNGTYVVSIALIICGFIMFTGISIYDVLVKTKDKMSNIAHSVNKESKPKVYNADDNDQDVDEEEVVTDSRRTVSKDELLNHNSHVEEQNEVVGEEYEQPNVCWEYPPINLLSKPEKNSNKENQEAIKKNIPTLEQVLRDFGIEGKVVSVRVGPAVTQYELEIKAGTRVSKILGLNREIALSLAAKDVRIQAPIPGKSTVVLWKLIKCHTYLLPVQQVLVNQYVLIVF